MLDDLSPHRLRIFVAVVECGGFKRAAESLHMTQPAVSAQLKYIRQIVGAPIFVRDGRRTALTEVGRSLYRYAQGVLETTEALRWEIRDLATASRDHLAVAAQTAFGSYVLPPLLSRFQRDHSALRISLATGLSHEVVERVRVGRADLGVVIPTRIPKEVIEDLTVSQLCLEQHVVIESPERPFSRGMTLTLGQLTKVPFVTNSVETNAQPRLNRLISDRGLEPISPIMELGSWEGTKAAVREGLGVAVVLSSVVQKELRQGELQAVVVEGLDMRVSVDLVCSPHRQRERMSPVFDELLSFLRVEVPRAVAA